MKKVFYLCALSFLACLQAQAQVDKQIGQQDIGSPAPIMETEKPKNEDPNQIYTVVQQNATFPGGQEAMAKFLRKNFQYPKNAQRMGITGKTYVRFVVTKTGEITDVTTLKGVQNCPECNEEALRLVKMMPKWEPAMQNGKPVNVYFSLPIVFQLDDDEVILSASFQGGKVAWENYLQQNLKYPKKAKKKKIEGEIVVKFSVEADGKITETSVQTGLPTCPECDAEALRLVQTMPAWTPQMRNGKAEKSQNTVIVPFKLVKK